MERSTVILVLLLFILLPLSIFAEEGKEEEKTWGYAPIVVPFYMPDTGFGGAVSVITYWNSDRSASRPDTAVLTAAYTENGQFFSGFNIDKYFFGENLLLTGKVGFNDWENTFYGIGGDPPPEYSSDYEEKFTTSGYDFSGGFAWRLARDVYLGPRWTFESNDMDELEDDGWLPGSGLPGLNGGDVSGPGLLLTLDTRDKAFYPTRGLMLEASFDRFDEDFGSDFNYDYFRTDFRIYRSIKPGHIIAGQLELDYTDGDLPFYSYPDLASRGNMRGLESGKFIDKVRFAGQAEYRFPVWRRFGGVLFASAGNVAPDTDDIVDDTHYAGGFGVRYTVETNQHINVRLDIGFDEDGEVNVYFTMREAF